MRQFGILLVVFLMAWRSSVTLAQTPDSPRRVGIPGTATLPANSSTDFQSPLLCPGPCHSPGGITVISQAMQSVTASYDGMTLTLTAPTGYVIHAGAGCEAETTVAQVVSCSLSLRYAVPFPSVTFTTMLGTGDATQAQYVTYPIGWNLLGLPSGSQLSTFTDVLYTYQSGDAAYELLPSTVPLNAGVGYWAYFSTATTVVVVDVGPQSMTRTLPAASWVMVGNPGQAPVAFSGADVVYTYDTLAGIYRQPTLLQPGQGAWAYSARVSTFSLTPGTP